MIRKLNKDDFKRWSNLYQEYAIFYNVPMNMGILETLWDWINDENHIVNGICFELNNKILELLIIEQCQDRLRVNI